MSGTAAAASPSQPIRLPGAGGIELAAEAWGDAGDPPLLLLHGGGQTRGSWSSSGARIAERGWRAIASDMRGHGESDWSPDGRYGIERFAADVSSAATSLGAPPVLVGASLGGISSIVAAGVEPRIPVRALVLVDVAHRPNRAGVDRIIEFMGRHRSGFKSVEEAAEAIAGYLPHRPRPTDLTGLERNLRRRDGTWVWHWDSRMLDDLGRAARAFDERSDELLRASQSIEAPILLVRGGTSDVVDETIAREFVESVPRASLVDVPRAGHMVVGDSNERFVAALLPFLDALD